MSIITATELVSCAERAAKEHWGYVYSGQGQTYTQELARNWADQERAGKSAEYFLEDCKKWLGKTVVDCSGLLVEAFRSKEAGFGDRTANTFRAQAVDHGSVSGILSVPGLAVWRRGHIGLYIGSGKVIEAGGTKVGVAGTPLHMPATGKAWTEWLQLRDVDYDRAPSTAEITTGAFVIRRLLKLKSPYMRGDDVRDVQEQLLGRRYDVGGTSADGVYGPNTTRAVKRFQRDKGFEVDGIVGPVTTKALGGVWTV